jgi:hypothetical protein
MRKKCHGVICLEVPGDISLLASCCLYRDDQGEQDILAKTRFFNENSLCSIANQAQLDEIYLCLPKIEHLSHF